MRAVGAFANGVGCVARCVWTEARVRVPGQAVGKRLDESNIDQKAIQEEHCILRCASMRRWHCDWSFGGSEVATVVARGSE